MAINSTLGVAAQPAVPDSDQYRSSQADPSVKAATVGKEVPSLVAKKMDPAQQAELVKQSVHQLNKFMNIVSIGLEFSVDSDTKQTVVKVMNKANGEIIRQIPSEEALKLSKAMDTLQGLIIQQKV